MCWTAPARSCGGALAAPTAGRCWLPVKNKCQMLRRAPLDLLCTACCTIRQHDGGSASCDALLVRHTSGRTVSSSSMQGSAMSGACPPKRAQSQYTTPACPLPFPAAPSTHSLGGKCRARAASARHSCVRMAGELRACCSVSCTSVSCRLCTADSGSSSKSRCTCAYDADHEANHAVNMCSCRSSDQVASHTFVRSVCAAKYCASMPLPCCSTPVATVHASGVCCHCSSQ